MTKAQFLKLWSLMMGAMDAITGLLLIIAPTQVLRLLKIDPPSAESLIYLSWIGVFVMAVGLSYALALGGRRLRGETVWIFTALVRILVAIFLTVRILDGSLAPAWAAVAISDGLVALVQGIIVRKGWWRDQPR